MKKKSKKKVVKAPKRPFWFTAVIVVAFISAFLSIRLLVLDSTSYQIIGAFFVVLYAMIGYGLLKHLKSARIGLVVLYILTIVSNILRADLGGASIGWMVVMAIAVWYLFTKEARQVFNK